MALIDCGDCGKQVSDKAGTCPHCGGPIVPKIKCTECGAMIDSTASKCPSCGNPIIAARPSNQTPTSLGSSTAIAGGEQVSAQIAEIAKAGVQPNISRIATGLLLLAISAYGTFAFIPAHNPGPILGLLTSDQPALVITVAGSWYFSPRSYNIMLLLGWVLMLAAVGEIIAGALHRPHVLAPCGRCGIEVAARKAPFGLICDRCQMWVRLNRVSLVLYAVMGSIVTAVLGGLLCLPLFFIGPALVVTYCVLKVRKHTPKERPASATKTP